MQGGDSGGSGFLVNDNGELLLLGTHSFVLNNRNYPPPFDERRASSDVYLPAYRPQILAVAGPEGSVFLFVAMIATAWLSVAWAKAIITTKR